jgi:hypothetical protein
MEEQKPEEQSPILEKTSLSEKEWIFIRVKVFMGTKPS